MDTLLILSKTKDQALSDATQLGLNSNQVTIVTNMDEFNSLGVTDGLYTFSSFTPDDGVLMRTRLQLTTFVQLPQLVTNLRSYLDSVLQEIRNISYRFSSIFHFTDSTRFEFSRQVKDLLDSCNIKDSMGFNYEIKFSRNNQLFIDPMSPKMRVFKDLLNAVSITKV